MKCFVIGLLIAIAIVDVLLILGCAELERRRNEARLENRRMASRQDGK